ncbi:MAG: hypothetical protein ACTSUP_07925 [Candidatus Heimdallarchaeaceae archaeon]
MKCNKCGSEIKLKAGSTEQYEPVDKKLIASVYDIPFYCDNCGAIKFSHQAIRGVVFIWPMYKFDTRFENKKSNIIIPETVIKSELSDIGIILSYGPGFYDKKNKNKWRQVAGLSVGMKVIYDKGVPWGIDVEGIDGKLYHVTICDFTDVMVEIDEYE